MLRHIILTVASWTAGQGLAAVAGQEKCTNHSNLKGSSEKICYRYIDEERALDKLTVAPTNGGINPRVAAYIVKGQVQIAGNSCQAQGLKAILQQETREGGTFAVARVRGWQRSDQVCIEIYQPVRSSLDLTLRGPSSELEKVLIKNAGELGLDVPLKSECLRPVSCPPSGEASVCFYGGLEFQAETLCQAQVDARKNACLKGVFLDALNCEESPFSL